MDEHFIESYEDEWHVLRKIEELKNVGYAESDMYVVARSNEQLTMIRTHSDVDYHVAEVKGMGRVGIFVRNGSFLRLFTEITDETKESARYYQQLLDGKLLLFCDKNIVDSSVDQSESSIRKVKTEQKNFSSQNYEVENNEEDQVFIDSRHYENQEVLQVDLTEKLSEQKSNDNKKTND